MAAHELAEPHDDLRQERCLPSKGALGIQNRAQCACPPYFIPSSGNLLTVAHHHLIPNTLRRIRGPEMSLIRPASRLITAPRARLHITLNPAQRLHQQHRSLSTTASRSAGDAHEDHYEPPTGWLFGVKPGEKYENEGWENVWYYGFMGSLLFGVIGYCYKPDTR